METFYDARHGLDRDTVLGAWVHRCTDCGGYSTFLRSGTIRYAYMSFVRYEEEYGSVVRSTTVIDQCFSRLGDILSSPGLHYIRWAQLYDQVYFLDMLINWGKELILERQQQTLTGDPAHFMRWHDVEYYAIPLHLQSSFFVAVPSW